MKSRKPQSYVLEMGLDANIGPGLDGTYSLVRSLARYDASRRPGVWAPAWDTEFQPGDRIAFRIFDYSRGATDKTAFQLKIFDLHFLDPADPTLLKSPFSSTNPILDNPISIGPGRLFQDLPGIKSVATSARKGWVLASDTGLETAPYYPGELFFPISKDAGRFLFRLVVKVTYDTGQGAFELRTYDHDPEIFVGETG
ncbi:MAG TPA: hypothetical protein VH988_08135 [Thermoanaerobaculia bacterium]|jgi:hypothetical protein|nr:hypothetical protein [Thermoanaerobaculia bacterium]